MAFVRKKVTSYKWPVTIFTPADGGNYNKETIDLEFLRIKRSELEQLTNLQLLQKTIKGWDRYFDEDGKEIPFSDDALEELLDDSAFVQSAAAAYWKSINGAAQAGN